MKKYTLVVTHDKDEGLTINGVNDGFNALEMLGLFLWKAHDIEEQLRGNVKPDVVTRKVVEPEDGSGEDAV